MLATDSLTLAHGNNQPSSSQPPTLHDARVALVVTLPLASSTGIGKLLFTPFSRLAEDGRYKAGLSIKRGQGSSTHDRVSIYVPTFTSVEGALIYARAMGNYESNDLALAA